MYFSNHQMPSLGYFHKVICDCLGLWSSDRKDVQFKVPATEEERRKALNNAFSAIKRRDGSYGTLDELVSATTAVAPAQREMSRKNKTIQDYTKFLSKEDFASYHEFIELEKYIHFIIQDKYRQPEICRFISKIYSSSLTYYREYIREHVTKEGFQQSSYIFFIKNILLDLIEAFSSEVSVKSCPSNSGHSANYFNDWPLKSFVDHIAKTCNVSLYKLHQFHDFRLNNQAYSDEEIWRLDLTSKPINSRSKQVIGRLKKDNKIKWETLYCTVKPLILLLPEGSEKDNFTINLYSAFLIHNLKNHLRENNDTVPTEQRRCYPLPKEQATWIPVTDLIDFLLNGSEQIDPTSVKTSMERYHNLTKTLSTTSSSLLKEYGPLSTLEFSYSNQPVEFPIEELRHKLNETPRWIDEWALARAEVASRNPSSVLQHYKNALKSAKYSSGPLYLPLYLEICAFCKHQLEELKKRNEEDLFDRFYEPLGSEAAGYAMLLGYTPGWSRDPKTLMPKSDAPRKYKLLIHKIDSMAKSLS